MLQYSPSIIAFYHFGIIVTQVADNRELEKIPNSKHQIPIQTQIYTVFCWNLEFVFWNLQVVRNLN